MPFDVFCDDLGFIEGPVWDNGSLFLTSISRGCLYQLDGTGNRIAQFSTGGGPNGAVAGDQGIFIAQNGGIFGAPDKAEPSVQWLKDGKVTSLFEGAFEAPNDICFGPDGRLFVTDPASEIGILEPIAGRLLACDLSSGSCQVLIEDRFFPNGLAFSADRKHLFLTQTYSRFVEKFEYAEGQLTSLGVFCTLRNGRPDGLAIDVEGNLWICTPGTGGIEVYDADGAFLDRHEFGDGSMTTNCCFGGEDGLDLFVTAAGLGSVLRLRAPHAGLPLLRGTAQISAYGSRLPEWR